MADGVEFQADEPATPAAGTVAASDDAGAAGHVQIIKLAISANGSATVIPADEANGLDVDVTRLPALPAGTNTIGKVRLVDADGDEATIVAGALQVAGSLSASAATYAASVDSTGLTTGATAYSIGDTLGAGWTFANAVAASAGEARLTGAVLLDKGDVTGAVDLWFASASITFGTDNAAPSISDTDAEKIVGTVSVSMQDLGGCRIGTWSGAMPYACDATSLYVYAVTRTAHNQFAATSNLRLTLLAEL